MIQKRNLLIIITTSIVLLLISTAYSTLFIGSKSKTNPKTIVNEIRGKSAENGVKSTRSDEEMRQLSNNYGQIRGGLNTHGFIDVDESNGHVFYHNSYRESNVYRYTSLANFITNTGSQQFNMPKQSEGTYHTVYKNHFYYAQYNSNTLVKCRTTDMGQVLTRALPNAGFHNRAHFNWGGYTDINLMSDETGLYVCWATSTSAAMQLSQLDENLNVVKTWNTGRNKGNVGWAFMVGGVLYWGNRYNDATFHYKYDTSTSSQSVYSNSLGAGGYITHTSYNADDNSLLVWNQGTVYRYPEIGGVRITNVESAALKGIQDDGKVCYAEYGSYNLSVNVTTTESLNDASELEVWLDYNTTNATLAFNWTHQEFYKLQDENGHVWLLVQDCSFSNNGDDKWFVNFSIRFNFTFPHEKRVDCYVRITASNGDSRLKRFPYICRVENDFEFKGTPFLFGDEQGKIEPGSWVKGNQKIIVSNLTVIYAGSPMVYPVDGFFDVRISDGSGRTWWDNKSSVEGISLPIRTRDITDPDEEFLITIENIPGSGICMTNLTFPIKIDADPPLSPVNLQCRAGDFKDKETQNTNQAEMYVTWDAVEDPASGLLGYYYSPFDNSGTTNGTFTNETEVKIDKLDEGYGEIFVWCIDNVGNIGDAATSGILIDLTPPFFSNHNPLDGSWHNHTDVECSIEVYDGEGSGVDGSTIEYSVSTNSEHGFDFWIPAWIAVKNEPMVPDIKYIFQEGEENYIKWRAKDISGNGFTESSSVNIKVDVSPINFAQVISPETDWYKTDIITTKIIVRDSGSSVDPGSLEARISISGSDDFGPWIHIEPENIIESGEDGYEITVSYGYAEGKDNYIMFRGTDFVGNPIAFSDKFNLKIDTSPVYFGYFTPLEDEFADSKKVECFIRIFDDGSGVDPATVEYSIANEAGGDDKSFGPWKKVVNVVSGNPTQVLLELEFDWGKDNFIRWRADDLMGTGSNISKSYRVWINSRPKVEISSPDKGSYFRFDHEIIFDASDSSDEDGGNLSYYWTSNVSANKALGSGGVINARLVPGKHIITVFVSDGNGYNESEKVKIVVGSKTDYERDSDGDGFSDGLEREKGTDPRNGAEKPAGEPDIVDTESAGILGEGSSMFFVILGGIFLLIIIIIVVLFIIRKKRKTEEKELNTAGLAIPQSPQYGPSQHPYPQGQFFPGEHKGYGETAQFQAALMGMPEPQKTPLMLPQGTGISSAQQFGTVPPNQFGQPQFPQYAPSPQQAQYDQMGSGVGITAGTNYILPSFTTEQGIQELNRMALPPGPTDIYGQETFGTPEPFPGSSTTPTQQIDILPDIGLTETPLPLPSPTISPSPNELQMTPEPAIRGPQVPIPEAAAQPSMETVFPSPEDPDGLSELDAYLDSINVQSQPPEPLAPAMSPVQEGTPTPMTNSITMQCHSCGNNYVAEISQFPALVTCPICQTQGVMESP